MEEDCVVIVSQIQIGERWISHAPYRTTIALHHFKRHVHLAAVLNRAK